MITVRPNLTESEYRELMIEMAKPITMKFAELSVRLADNAARSMRRSGYDVKRTGKMLTVTLSIGQTVSKCRNDAAARNLIEY